MRKSSRNAVILCFKLPKYCLLLYCLLANFAAMGLPASVEKPERLYLQYCSSCHADDGAGEMPGVPDLHVNKTWLQRPEAELFNRIEKGFQTPGSPLPMPAKGGAQNLSDQQLLEVIRYMQKTFK